ncbi:MAG: hypothetical protein WKG07_46170 [Hymenobacter sp.]
MMVRISLHVVSRHWSAKGAISSGLKLNPMIREAVVRRALGSLGCAFGRNTGRMLRGDDERRVNDLAVREPLPYFPERRFAAKPDSRLPQVEFSSARERSAVDPTATATNWA